MKLIQYLKRLWKPERYLNDGNHSFFHEFVGQPQNAWISQHPIVKKSLENFFRQFPSFTLERLRRKNLFFVLSNGHMSCAITYQEDANIVLIFPDLYKKLISSDPMEAYAILAHELGHIVNGHGFRAIDPLDAQFEADAFACSLGFRDQICRLLQQENSEESKIRLKVINRDSEFLHEKLAA